MKKVVSNLETLVKPLCFSRIIGDENEVKIDSFFLLMVEIKR